MQIVTSLSFFQFYGQSGSRILDAWSVKLTFSLIVLHKLTKTYLTGDKTKKPLTQLLVIKNINSFPKQILLRNYLARCFEKFAKIHEFVNTSSVELWNSWICQTHFQLNYGIGQLTAIFLYDNWYFRSLFRIQSGLIDRTFSWK